MFVLSQDDFPNLDPAAEGEIVPYLLGRYPQSPGIPVQVGLVDKLREAMLFDNPPSGGAIKLSDVDVIRRLPNAGTVQINSERLTYSSKDLGSVELRGITRGAQGTAPGNHDVNTGVFQILDLFIYIVAENPGFHTVKSVSQVYMDGRPKRPSDPPTHTVNLNDDTLVDGHRFVTITFNMATIPPRVIEPPPPSRRQAPVPSHRAAARRRASPPRSIPAPSLRWSNYFARSAGAAAAAGWLPLSDAISLRTAAVPPPSTSIVFEWPTPVLGTIAVDIDGLQDDSAGSITGSPTAFLDRLMWQARLLLREVWSERDDALYDLATFTATHAEHVNIGLRTAQRYGGEGFDSWRDALLHHGRADLFNESGTWKYVWRQRRAPTVILDEDDLAGRPVLAWGPRSEIATVLEVHYGVSSFEHAFTLKSGRAIPRFGVQRRVLDLPWIFDETPARVVGSFWLDQWDRPPLLLTVPVKWRGYRLEVGDTFHLDHPIMDPYGRQHIGFLLVERVYRFANGGLELGAAEIPVAQIVLDEGLAVLTVGTQALTLAEDIAVAVSIYKGAQPYHALEGGLGAELVGNAYVG